MNPLARLTGLFNPRGAHRSPPLRVVREQRDQARKEAAWYALRASRAEDRVKALKGENARLRARVAFLENQGKVSIPAPMSEAPTMPIQITKPTGARVVPLHLKPVGA